MKVRTWLIVVTCVGVILVLSALFIVREVWFANAQIDAWSQIKYSPTQPPPELPIEIIGKQFEWRIRYPSSRRFQSERQLVENFAKESNADKEQEDDLHIVNQLHLWKGGVAQIHLKSADIRHSIFLPVMRLKEDAIPGKVTGFWLKPNKSNITWDAEAEDWKQADEWEFVCVEHSSNGLGKMIGQLFIHETKDDFLKWLKEAEKSGVQPAKEGR